MTHKQKTPHPRRHFKKATKLRLAAPTVSAPVATGSTDVYKQAIEIAASPFDARKIVIALAKAHPELFVQLHRQTTTVDPWQREVVTAVYQTNMVGAIKLTREKTGLGLKEAKDVIDNLRVYMSQNGYMMSSTSSFPPSPLSATTEPVYKQLSVAASNML